MSLKTCSEDWGGATFQGEAGNSSNDDRLKAKGIHCSSPSSEHIITLVSQVCAHMRVGLLSEGWDSGIAICHLLALKECLS